MHVSIKNRFGLSLKPHVLDLKSFEFPESTTISSIIAKATVKRIDTGLGLLFCIPCGDNQTLPAYAHISRIADHHIDSIDNKRFKISSNHKCRVVGHDMMDGVALVSLQPTVLEAQFLRHQDLKPGMVIKNAVILKLEPVNDNLIVDLCNVMGIRALCPKTHLADVPKVTHPEKRFKVGDKLTVRVLSVDLRTKKIVVTHKRSLVNSSLPIVDSVGTAKQLLQSAPPEGVWVHGVVAAVKPYGCVVTMFGDMRGLLHISHLSEARTENIGASCVVGQLLKCRLLSVDEEQNNLKLSLLEPSMRDFSNGKSGSIGKYTAGDRVSAKITQINEHEVVLAIGSDAVVGVLTVAHLSDHSNMAATIKQSLKVGQVLDDLMVLRREKFTSTTGLSLSVLALSRKYTLLNKSKVSLFGSTTFSAGSACVGVVQRLDASLGVFVKFSHDSSALVMKSNIDDQFVHDVMTCHNVGDTVFGILKNVDMASNRFSMSLRPSDIEGLETRSVFIAEMSKSYFADLDFIHANGITSSYKVGAKVQGTFKQIIPKVGTLVEVAPNVDGLFVNEIARKKKAGDVMEGTILDSDAQHGVLDLCAPGKYRLSENLGADSTFEVTVVFAKAAYAGVATKQGDFGYIMTTGSRFGQKLTVKFVDRTQSCRNIFVYSQEVKSVPVTDSPTSIVIGAKVSGLIKSIKDTQMNIQIVKADPTASPPVMGINGRVHITELVDDVESILEFDSQKTTLFEALGYKQGGKVDAVVTGFHSAKTHQWLPITQMGGRASIVDLSVRLSALENVRTDVVNPAEDFVLGSTVTAFVSEVFPASNRFPLILHIGPHARAKVPMLEISSTISDLNEIEIKFAPGTPVKCMIVKKPDGNGDFFIASIRAVVSGCIWHDLSCLSTLTDATVGRIIDVNPARGLLVQLADLTRSIAGWVPLVDIADKFEDDITARFEKNQLVRCKVVSIVAVKKEVNVSLRLSDVDDDKTVENEVIAAVSDIKSGKSVSGYVKAISDNALFVMIGRNNLVARVKICDMFDGFIKDWQEKFSVGQVVRGTIIHVDQASEKIDMSLKSQGSSSGADDASYKHLDDIQVGETYAGTVCRIEPYGVFVNLDESGKSGRPVRGLCHHKEVSDDPDSKHVDVYNVDDRVKVIILNVDKEGRKLSLGMKRSYFKDTEESDVEDAIDVEDEMPSDDDTTSDISDSDLDESDSDDESPKVMDDESVPTTRVEEDTISVDADTSALAVGGFDWNTSLLPPAVEDTNDSSDEESSDSEDDTLNNTAAKKLSRRTKLRLKREEEAHISAREAQAADDETPTMETAEDFNRLVVSSPNSSVVWIRYMAFFLQMVEIDKARQVAERALKTISFREEKEKFNVWIALLNLENRYGTPQSLSNVLERAVSYSNPKHIYLALFKIYDASGNTDKVSEVYATLRKKFKTSCKVWSQMGMHHYSKGNLAEARKTFEQSLICLPKLKHIKNIMKFAQYEYKYGDAERGRTIVEGVLSNFPKRVDLWSVYVDMEIKANEIDAARRLFDRVITLRFSSKKMKFFFKKFLEFEKKHGNDESVAKVMDAARSYVASVTGNVDEQSDNEELPAQ